MRRWEAVYAPEDGNGGGTPNPSVDPPSPPPNPDPTPVSDPPTEPAADAPQPWYLARIGTLTAQKRAADEKVAQVEARLAELERASKQPQTPPVGSLTEEEVERRAQTRAEKLAEEKAEKLASQRVFTSQLVDMANRGRKELGQVEFNAALQTFAQNFGDLPTPFLEACLESGEGHKVILELSKDLDRASQIMMASSPAKIGAAVAKVAGEIAAKAAPANGNGGRKAPVVAPAPITPQVGGGANSGGDPLTRPQSTRDWIMAREQQLKASRR